MEFEMGKTEAVKGALSALRRVRPLLKGRKRAEVRRAIEALEEEAKVGSKAQKTDWVLVSRLMLYAAEVIKFLSE
jgi:hypothetical protein